MDPAFAGRAENGIPTYSLQAHTTGQLPILVLGIMFVLRDHHFRLSFRITTSASEKYNFLNNKR